MFKMMDKDKNGNMDFTEWVLILVLPKSAEEMTAEQFANRKLTYEVHRLSLIYLTR